MMTHVRDHADIIHGVKQDSYETSCLERLKIHVLAGSYFTANGCLPIPS